MSNADVLAPIQVAILDRLSPTLTALDEVPKKTAYPYVVVGEATSTPRGANDRFGARTTITLHVWSAYHGWGEALGIVDDLMLLLDHQPLPISGHSTVAVRHEQTATMRDPDPDLRHAVVRFSIETEHPA